MTSCLSLRTPEKVISCVLILEEWIGEIFVARIMIAATGSGSGKTTITCAILQALQNRGYRLTALKCGPDYIDPMFHRTITGTAAGNLDSFFMSPDFLRARLGQQESKQDLCILESAMGFYDGLGSTMEASAWQVANETGTPVILILSCRGMGCHSIAAMLRGFCLQQKEHQIKGVIFNQLSAGLYAEVCAAIEDLSVQPLGYFPKNEAFHLGSRHLGLITAAETEHIQELMQQLARQAEQSLNLEGLLQLSQMVTPCSGTLPNIKPVVKVPVRIAVARDQAFCFLYQENIDLLERLGAELVYFSPLQDACLPENCSGLYLCGGYPELYGTQLSQNKSLLHEIKTAIQAGMPTIAECGGFLYLHSWLEDEAGHNWPLVGVLSGKAWPTGKLQRFGYVTLMSQSPNLAGQNGQSIRGHEFHYWESDCCGVDFLAEKPKRNRSWLCAHSNTRFYAGFPHLYFYSNPAFAQGFVREAAVYARANTIIKNNSAGFATTL